MAFAEAKLLITADDRTGAAFKAISEHVAKISAMSKEIGRLGTSAGGLSGGVSLAAELERAEAAAKHFGSTLKAASETVAQIGRGFDGVAVHARRAEQNVTMLSKAAQAAKHAIKELSPLAMGGAGFGALETTKEFVKSGAEIQTERARMGVAGIPEQEISAADLQSAKLAAKYPNVSRSAILENYRELRSVLQNKEETPEMMETLIEARSSMDALDPSGKSASGLKYAIKGAEILGKAKNKEAFREYLDGFIRAQQVMGSTVDAEQLGDFAKYTRSSGPLLSNRFLHTTANSLIQEEKGSTAGKMVYDVVKEMTGGFEGYQTSAKELIDLKLANDEDFIHDKKGGLHGLLPGKHIQDWRLWQTDPDRAVWEKLVPAMEAKGLDQQEQIATVRRLFPNSLAADLVSKLILQRPSFENHSKQYPEATGISGGQQLLQNDPKAALNELGTAIATFGGTVTSSVMKDAAATMSSMASTIGSWGESLAKWQKENPELSKLLAGGAIASGLAGGGALGFGMFKGLTSGFGLTGAAADLTAAAEALKGAAVANGGARGPNGPLAPNKPGENALGLFSVATIQAWLYDIGTRFISDALPTPKNAFTHGRDIPYLFDRVREHASNLYEKVPGSSGTWSHGTFHQSPSGYGRDFTLGSNGGFTPGPGTLVPPGGFAYGSNFDWHHNTGRSPLGLDPNSLMVSLANLKATVEGPITAQLTGEATVKVDVKVTPSSPLLQAFATATSTSIRPAATGTSMPEAAPNARNATGKQ